MARLDVGGYSGGGGGASNIVPTKTGSGWNERLGGYWGDLGKVTGEKAANTLPINTGIGDLSQNSFVAIAVAGFLTLFIITFIRR